MKIVHVISDSNVGGAGIWLENLLRKTDMPRRDITVILPREAAMVERYRAFGIQVRPILEGADCSFALRDLPRLWHYFWHAQPTIVHTHASLVGRVAATLAGVPVRLATRHCAYPVRGMAGAAPLRFLRRVCDAVLTTRTVATAKAAKENLVALGIAADRITVIPNGVPPVARLSPAARAAGRAALGIGADDFCVGMCARLEAVKGHATLLAAARILREHGLPCHFLLVGGGREESALRAMAADLGIGAKVSMTGHVPDPGYYTNLFDVAVNCSTGTETACLALSEAMSLGIPAIVSRYGGNPEMVEEGKNGLLFPPQDATALARAIEKLARDAALYHRLSEGAAERYRRAGTDTAMARAYDALYRALTMRKGARRVILEQ